MPLLQIHRNWLAWIAASALTLGTIAAIFISIHWPFRYRNVEPFLQRVLASQVHIAHYHRIYFPHPGFIADDITLRRNTAPDLPPVGHATRLIVQGRWIDLLLFRKRLQFVDIDGLHVVIPPVGSHANHEDFPPGSSTDFAGPTILLDHMLLHDATLELLRNNGSRYVFPIHRLDMGDLQQGRTVSYDIDMDSPLPMGHILSTGTFGPLRPHHLALTPLSGRYTYSPVHLESIPSLRGTLSATGSFHGTLADIEANGQSSTPDFAVGQGRPTAIANTAEFSINALNADIHIRSLTARTGKTLVQATGNLLGSPKTTNLDLIVNNGRIQDIFHPFLQHASPVTGAVRLRAHAYVAPPAPHVTFLQRLVLQGTFDIPAQHITDRSTEQNLTAFSLRARKNPVSGGTKTSPAAPSPGDPEDASSDVLSGLGGPATIRNAVASTSHLTFQVPGATINLAGTFNLLTQEVHLLGNLHMESELNHVTTGFKSFLLIPLDPFFKKRGSGAVLPIAVTGGPNHYKISQDLFHNK